jgi:uncharacterized protein (UPF0147 family)
MVKLAESQNNSILNPSLSHSLSSYEITPYRFHLDSIIQSFREPAFLSLSYRKRFKKVNQILCQLIQEAPAHAFLLSAVLDYLERVNKEKILNESLRFVDFEFWLNHFSELSPEDNYHIRAKVVGKWMPRHDYQAFFPIGMERVYSGSHFITAHLSPDIDTMIASFWGWIDAFAARVGSSLHLWCLPGGPPDSPVTAIFRSMFDSSLFSSLARTSQTLTVTAMDLVSQQNFIKEKGETLISAIDHGSNDKAIILVNEQGHYLGDWRSSDVELVRQINIIFKSCLRWFENNLHTNLISLFAHLNCSSADLPGFYASIFDIKIGDCEPALEFNEKQKKDLHDFFNKVLGISQGIQGTFRDLILALHQRSISKMYQFMQEVESLAHTNLFDDQGRFKEDRPLIFTHLDKLIKHLDDAIQSVRNYVERLDIVIDIKHKVLGLPLLYTTLRSDVEEIQLKMQNHQFLTVVIYEQDGSLFPVGVVRAVDLRKNALGTVSLRDFCNLEEVKMASYLEVISVVDHHKSSLKTNSAPLAIIGDAQSCNVLIAEQQFMLNDRYSTNGMALQEIEQQIQEVLNNLSSPSQARLLQRLLQRRLVAQSNQPYYIHPDREFNEYLSFLQAILDDTDLLTKVSNRDIECVKQLLNRMKSLSLKREVEIINLDDIPKDKNFAKTAAQRILQQLDMYSLYKQVYSLRELEVETNLDLCLNGLPSNIFLDTKEQNGCARVGQTKIFASNFNYFSRHVKQIRQIWLNKAQEVHRNHPEIDFHLHMISTITSAEEVYKNQIVPYEHQDELWFWIPPHHQAVDHLISFLASFQTVARSIKDKMWVEFLGPNAHELDHIFQHNFLNIPRKIAEDHQKGLPIAVLHFKASTLNSRKSMITPFIPRLIP